MTKAPDFDLPAAHRYFSAHCFNRAWDLIDKKDRTPAEDCLMVSLNQASIFHWSQRADETDKNRSIGYWQASRIQALLGNALEAHRFGEICLTFSHALEPFYLGYAYEALARAAKLVDDTGGFNLYMAAATKQAAAVPRQQDRTLLEADLQSLT